MDQQNVASLVGSHAEFEEAEVRGKVAPWPALFGLRDTRSGVTSARAQGLSATRAALARALDIVGGRSSWWPAFAFATWILLLRMAPIEWNQNEINYMALALKSVAPERFPALTAIFARERGPFCQLWPAWAFG